MLKTLPLIFALSLGASAANANQTLIGRASVIDGDTIEIHGERVRLHGIDAPESRQVCKHQDGAQWRCGRDAAFALDELLQGKTVSCSGNNKDRYKRLIARCRVGSIDLGSWMVQHGWALAYERYSADYIGPEKEARANQRGIWSGAFENPEAWRRSR